MRELPPRTYTANTRAEQRVLPYGIQHPAKMHPALCRDLFLRYTLPGQTALDPFGGRGTSLIGATLGRNVILNELEPPFVEHIRANWEHLKRHTLPGVPLGDVTILQGDSRTLPLPAAADACISSPPYADVQVLQWDGRTGSDGAMSSKHIAPLVGYGSSGAQIGNLARGDVAAVLSSPPYGDVASRDRSEEPYSQQMDPALKAKYGTGDTNRHVDGYGDTPGQIGSLPHAAITSPPFVDAREGSPRNPSRVASDQSIGASQAQLAEREAWGITPGQIGHMAYAGVTEWLVSHENEQAETYAGAMLQVLAECHRVVRPGGVLVLVTGNYVRDGAIIDLAADTIALAQAAGWTPWERWRHEKSQVSFWRRLHHKQGRPVVTHEDVLVFVKGDAPAWDFAELAPTYAPPASLAIGMAGAEPPVAVPLPIEVA